MRMIKLNKKLGYIFVVLVLGLFFISACEQGGIGAKPARQLERGNGEVIRDNEVTQDRQMVISTMATGETSNGIKLVSVSVSENQVQPDSCNIEYQERIYTINEKYAKKMNNGKIIGVLDITISNEQRVPDYCEIMIIL